MAEHDVPRRRSSWRLSLIDDLPRALTRGLLCLAVASLVLLAASQAGAEPPPLVIEPIVPPIAPEKELERDPGGALVLPNVRANDNPGGGCADDRVANFCAQNETTFAVNPENNDNWVGGANDYSGDNIVGGRAQSNCGVYTSLDAGQTWSHQLLPFPPGFNMGGDPSVAFDRNGNLYYACMFLLRADDFDIDEHSMFVLKSDDGGVTFGPPTEVVSSLSPGGDGAHDKELLATGVVSDRVWLAWTDSGAIRFAGSDDGGGSFTAPAAADNVVVDDSGVGLGAVIAPRRILGIGGDTDDSEHVYVAWMDMTNNRILFDRSTDNGASFGEDIIVEANVAEFPERTVDAGTGAGDEASIVGEFGEDFGNPENAFRVNSAPGMDVCNNPSSPHFGTAYIIMADNRNEDGDVFLYRSSESDEGEISFPAGQVVRVNNDAIGNGVDQFFPWIDVDEDCKINVAFYDRRDDEPDHLRFHLYLAHSDDGGDSFDEFRVSTQPSTNAQFQGAFIGDYLQVAATTAESATFHHQVDRAAVLWTDTREGAQDVYAATILQTNGGTWINVDVDLVADLPATDLDFIFPGDVTNSFGAIYHGAANPFQDDDISYDPEEDETTLSFIDPSPGPLQPGDVAHVGFLIEANVPFAETFWTGSDNIGDIAMLSPEFTYDPQDRIATAELCNDRIDGRSVTLGAPEAAVVDLPIELEHLNDDDLAGQLAAQGTALGPLPLAVGPLAPGDCYTAEIPGGIAPYQAIVLRAPLFFTDQGRSRTVLFAQKIAKDAREVDAPPRERFLYDAKLVCGTQPRTRDLALARGHYATTINVLNTTDRPARIRKTLALAVPPGAQRPGKVIPIGRETLSAGHAMATECNDIARRAFGGALPAPVIDGYVRIVSDRRLEVTGVYTTATLNAEGTAEDHSSIHIQQVPGRRTKARVDRLRADLIIDDSFSIDPICGQRRCRVFLDFKVRNIGAGAAGPFTIDIVRSDSGAQLDLIPMPAGLVAGGSKGHSATVAYEIVPNDPRKVCIRADAPDDTVPETDEGNNALCIGF